MRADGLRATAEYCLSRVQALRARAREFIVDRARERINVGPDARVLKNDLARAAAVPAATSILDRAQVFARGGAQNQTQGRAGASIRLQPSWLEQQLPID